MATSGRRKTRLLDIMRYDENCIKGQFPGGLLTVLANRFRVIRKAIWALFLKIHLRLELADQNTSVWSD